MRESAVAAARNRRRRRALRDPGPRPPRNHGEAERERRAGERRRHGPEPAPPGGIAGPRPEAAPPPEGPWRSRRRGPEPAPPGGIAGPRPEAAPPPEGPWRSRRRGPEPSPPGGIAGPRPEAAPQPESPWRSRGARSDPSRCIMGASPPVRPTSTRHPHTVDGGHPRRNILRILTAIPASARRGRAVVESWRDFDLRASSRGGFRGLFPPAPEEAVPWWNRGAISTFGASNRGDFRGLLPSGGNCRDIEASHPDFLPQRDITVPKSNRGTPPWLGVGMFMAGLMAGLTLAPHEVEAACGPKTPAFSPHPGGELDRLSPESPGSGEDPPHSPLSPRERGRG